MTYQKTYGGFVNLDSVSSEQHDILLEGKRLYESQIGPSSFTTW
ncbi:hypothetical protein SAMN00768000_3503 [Sulfobacillus thermosulfidooxidans DSM 9293]|uniref:Uncharacterized protein n=1 Tax=Sulfobacillus thermosulfidooxidans (strain DSM 9293 / VKM B-1269 / AT-1) TaxID=929705 RepID=A0A1W1WNU4_SULTA|nr:hypothetical protein [Sulfobacillus thermosulfidooxidans]SMC07872.1 hypothetical protein SAMN00768000_3503 [Sulfobacillus thermosulfidooxidans DSM 9293]